MTTQEKEELFNQYLEKVRKRIIEVVADSTKGDPAKQEQRKLKVK
jgi:hypothetical protein